MSGSVTPASHVHEAWPSSDCPTTSSRRFAMDEEPSVTLQVVDRAFKLRTLNITQTRLIYNLQLQIVMCRLAFSFRTNKLDNPTTAEF